MKILITGGLGNIGSWITHYFLHEHEVTVISRKESNHIKHKNYKFIEADITDLSQLKKSIDTFYDICIHTASYNEYFDDNYAKNALLINSLGTEFLCDALSVNGVGRLIYFSTIHVYGDIDKKIDENTYIKPKNDYGLTHFFAEKYIEKYFRNNYLNYVILRLSNSYGCPIYINTNKWYLLLNDLCTQAIKNKSLQLSGNGRASRDFIWMGDVVSILNKIIKSKNISNDCYNLTSGINLTTFEVSKIVAETFREVFNRNVEISLNKDDLTNYKKINYTNYKLLNVINHEFTNQISKECRKIFKMIS